MPDEINSDWNYAVCFIEFLFNGLVLASGSGFFWQSLSGKVFLISNWHNFSGRSNEDEKPLSPTAATPDSLRFSTYTKISDVGENGQFEAAALNVEMPLIDKETDDTLWLEHANLGRKVDLAAIDVSGITANSLIKPANSLETDSGKKFYPSQDVFIVGYPLGLVAKHIPVPVWKRGTIATEPYINPDGKPLIYVDAATRKGMSGSIVIAKDILFGPYEKKDGTVRKDIIVSHHRQIVGIYSGRLSPHNIEAQIGIVWKRELIDELVNSG